MSLIILRALAADAAFVPLRTRHWALTGQQWAQLSCVLWVYPDNGLTDYLEQWRNYWDNRARWFSAGVWIGLWHFLIWFCWERVGVWQQRTQEKWRLCGQWSGAIFFSFSFYATDICNKHYLQQLTLLGLKSTLALFEHCINVHFHWTTYKMN